MCIIEHTYTHMWIGTYQFITNHLLKLILIFRIVIAGAGAGAGAGVVVIVFHLSLDVG